MSLRNPPPQIPVVRFDSPNKTDLGLVEFWNTEVAAYVPIDIGTPHPNTRQYSGYTLGLQAPVEGDEKWVRRVWVTDNTNQDWFNYQIQFAEQAKDYPTYIRVYQERRDTYTPRTPLSPLQTVFKLTLAQTGSGYDPSLKWVPLTFSAGTAAGRALIDADGKIRSLVLDSGGGGYMVAPTFTIPDPTNAGVTATGTAAIQPTTALLVKEQAEEYPEDNENFAIYFNVVRVYMTLPGPWIFDDLYRGAGKYIDPESLALITVRKRINIPDDITPSATVSAGSLVTVERKDIDSNTAWEVEKTIGQSAFHSLATAQTSDSPDSFPWPGLLDVDQVQASELANVGYVPKQSRRLELTTSRYWVNSTTEPTPPSWDAIIEDPSCMVGKAAGFGTTLPIIGTYSNVLHDAYSILFTNGDGTNITASYAATTPTLATWRTWVGTRKKIIPPKVVPTSHAYQWLIEEYSAIIPQLEYLSLS